MSGLPPLAFGLLRFCLEHSDAPGLQKTDLSKYNHTQADYEWLMSALNNLESDSDRVKKLIETLKKPDITKVEILYTLEGLQYYAEDLDVANDLDKLGGFNLIVDYLSHDDPAIRKWAAWIVGTTCHNNPESQVIANKYNTLDTVFNLLKKETDIEVRNKFLVALSALISQNKEAQKRLLQNHADALDVLLSLLKEGNHYTKLKVIWILKSIMFSFPESRDLMRKTDIPIELIKNLSNENNQLREGTLHALIAYLTNHEINQQTFKSLGVDKFLLPRMQSLVSLKGEEASEKEEELELTKQLFKAVLGAE